MITTRYFIINIIFFLTKSYSPHQIARIEKCIMATQLPQTPGDDILCQIMCDADLYQLGTDLCLLRSECLR